MIPIFIQPEALDDIRDAYQWYEYAVSGLGESFLQQLQQSYSLISQKPQAYAVVHRDATRCIVRKFPYQIIFVENPNGITIVAVFHSMRNPLEMKKRLNQ